MQINVGSTCVPPPTRMVGPLPEPESRGSRVAPIRMEWAGRECTRAHCSADWVGSWLGSIGFGCPTEANIKVPGGTELPQKKKDTNKLHSLVKNAAKATIIIFTLQL